MTRKALGRGLESLIPDYEREPDTQGPAGVTELPLEEVVPGRLQPRRRFPPEALGELADSIRENGVVQPIIVQLGDNKKYEIICGERRWRAARQAGLRKIPVLVREATSTERLQLALIENIHRQDLNPIEEAQAYQRLAQEFGLTQEAIARNVGKNRASIANTLRLLKLSRAIQDDLVAGRLSFGHGRAILGLDAPKEQEVLRAAIVKKGLSVREAEAWVQRRQKSQKRAGGKTPARRKNVFTAGMERELERRLGTRVQIEPSKKGGKLVVTYYSNDDLTRIRDIILSGQ